MLVPPVPGSGGIVTISADLNVGAQHAFEANLFGAIQVGWADQDPERPVARCADSASHSVA